MCGRFGLWLEEGIFHRFNIVEGVKTIPLNYNIAPGMTTLVVTHNSPNKAELMRWGLIPPWAKDIRIGFKMINARAETILEKPTFRKCFTSKRCLIPFNAFYEWREIEKQKYPYLFHDEQQPYLSFAGLYEIAQDADGKELKSFTIITTVANRKMGGIHARMPVILTESEESIWLDHSSTQAQLVELLDGYTSKTFTHYPIDAKINSAANNGPEVIEPLIA